jgi:hypothetical protein
MQLKHLNELRLVQTMKQNEWTVSECVCVCLSYIIFFAFLTKMGVNQKGRNKQRYSWWEMGEGGVE